MRKIKICFILPYNNPVPAVIGGAIETILNLLIDENENHKNFAFTIVCKYNESAEKASIVYKHTAFKYFKVQNNTNYYKRLLHRVFRKLFNKVFFLSKYDKECIDFLLENDFDYVVNESANFYIFDSIKKKYVKRQLIAHLHYNVVGNKFLDNIYGKIISISNYVSRQWYEKEQLSKNKIYTLYNCIDTNKFSQVRSSSITRDTYSFASTDFVLVFCGRIIQEKGVLELLYCMDKLHLYPQIKLLIVGSSNFGNSTLTQYELEIQNYIKNRLSNKVTFTGFIHNNDLPQIYKLSDIVVMPSIWQEPAGLVEVEAMAAGKPCIVTNVGGISEIVSHDCCILVENDDALVQSLTDAVIFLYKNPNVRLNMSKAGLNKVSDYTTASYYHKFSSIITD